MSIKLILFIFIGFLSTCTGKIKAEENFCYYDSPIEYERCLKKNSLKPKIIWPFSIGKAGKYALRQNEPHKYYQLRSNNGENLVVAKGKFGIGFRKKFIDKNIILISRERMLGWNVIKNTKDPWYNWKARKYNINYLDESFRKKQIIFWIIDEDFWGNGSYLKGDVVSEFLSEITGLYKDEQRSKNYIDNIIGGAIKDLIKKQEIITALIKVQNSDLQNCIELNKVKFPELTERTKNIEQKIYSLRSKLDLPPSSDLKPICN